MAGIGRGRAVQAEKVIFKVEGPLSIPRFIRPMAASIFRQPSGFGRFQKLTSRKNNHWQWLGAYLIDDNCLTRFSVLIAPQTQFTALQLFASFMTAWTRHTTCEFTSGFLLTTPNYDAGPVLV